MYRAEKSLLEHHEFASLQPRKQLPQWLGLQEMLLLQQPTQRPLHPIEALASAQVIHIDCSDMSSSLAPHETKRPLVRLQMLRFAIS